MSIEGSKRAIILTIRSYQTMLILLLFYTYENNRKSSLTGKLDNLKTFFKNRTTFLGEQSQSASKKCIILCFYLFTDSKSAKNWPKTVKNGNFGPKSKFLKVFWHITSNFVIKFGWKLPKIIS